MAIESPVNKIKKNLSDHSGEPVLVVTRKWEKMGWDMPESRTPYAFAEKLYLGITKKPFIKDDNLYGLEIITNRHVVSNDWLRRDEISLETGSIQEWGMMSFDLLNQKLGPKPGRCIGVWGGDIAGETEDTNKLALEIVVGEKLVTDWFIYQAQFGRMPVYQREYLEKVASGETPESSLAKGFRKNSLDLKTLIGYQRMRLALGLTAATLPPKIDVEVKLEIRRKKFEILNTIEQLFEKDKELQEALKKAKEITLPRITIGYEPNYEREVQKDEEDLRRMKSGIVDKKRSEIEFKLQKAVVEAVSWGLHLTPWEIQDESRPGITKIINVPVLVTDLARYFEIPLVGKKDKI